jgi:nucleoside-diphosphate-sugar epimerase
MDKRILVIGATGLLGQPVTLRLQADGFQVRLLARDPEKARRMFGEAFEVVPGDVTEVNSLERAILPGRPPPDWECVGAAYLDGQSTGPCNAQRPTHVCGRVDGLL